MICEDKPLIDVLMIPLILSEKVRTNLLLRFFMIIFLAMKNVWILINISEMVKSPFNNDILACKFEYHVKVKLCVYGLIATNFQFTAPVSQAMANEA